MTVSSIGADAIAEMREKGMVTMAELAAIWGTSYGAVRHYLKNGSLPGWQWHKEAKLYFVPRDSNKPAKKPGPPSSGLTSADRSRAYRRRNPSRKMTTAYRDSIVELGSEQIPLEVEWSMWRAPGFVKLSLPILFSNRQIVYYSRIYNIYGKSSLGWLGGGVQC